MPSDEIDDDTAAGLSSSERSVATERDRLACPEIGRLGYADPAYALSLDEFGTPVHLENSGGTLLVRPVPRRPILVDGMGPYPLFACSNWRELDADLAALRARLISVTLVTDPFGDWTIDTLDRTFPDLMVPFKEHFVVDLTLNSEHVAHHRRNVRRALERVEVDQVEPSDEVLEDWKHLYANLVSRHSIRGITAFSDQVFEKQFKLPDLRVLRASVDGRVVGMTLWIIRDDVAYYHLGSYSDEGYSSGASFASFSTAFQRFAESGIRWVSLGAGAGSRNADGTDGLTRFKSGWSTGTRTAYLCGRILQPGLYEELCDETLGEASSYFPAYRFGEFA